MNSLDAMSELTTDQIGTDPEYAIEVIRAYVNGGGVMSAGWVLALLEEIERLNGAIDATFETTESATLTRARSVIQRHADEMHISVPQADAMLRELAA